MEEFNTLDFVGEGVLAATFVTQQSVPGAQRRDDPNRVRPYLLHAIFLDAATGKVLNTIEWPADDPNVGIFPRHAGGFLFFSTEHIVICSTEGCPAEGNPVKELPLPQLQATHVGHIGIAESPNGKSLVVRYQKDDSTTCIHIDTETLEFSEGPCAISRLFSISDSAMAARSDKYYDRPETSPVQPEFIGSVQKSQLDLFGSAQIQEQGKPARKLCDTSSFAACKVPQFLNNEKIVVFDWYALGLINARETIPAEPPKLQMKLTHHEWIDIVGRPVRASANGERFAVAINLPPPSLKGRRAPSTLSSVMCRPHIPATLTFLICRSASGFTSSTTRRMCRHLSSSNKFGASLFLRAETNSSSIQVEWFRPMRCRGRGRVHRLIAEGRLPACARKNCIIMHTKWAFFGETAL